jgi:hypothetical protein
VEARREDSGNMAFGGRELSVEEALAAKAGIDADAVALRNAGAEGSLRQLRVLAYLDRLQARNPLDRITARPGQDGAGTAGPPPGGGPAQSGGPGDEEDEGRPGGPCGGPQGPGTPPGALAPLPALITLVVTAGTCWAGPARPAAGGRSPPATPAAWYGPPRGIPGPGGA